jgi:hypothetical protein
MGAAYERLDRLTHRPQHHGRAQHAPGKLLPRRHVFRAPKTAKRGEQRGCRGGETRGNNGVRSRRKQQYCVQQEHREERITKD